MSEIEEPTPVGEEWLKQFIETGTVAQRSVEIYNRPDLRGRFDELEREYERAKAIEESGEMSLGDSGLDVVREKMEELHRQWTASKSVWFLRALGSDEVSAMSDSVKRPDEVGDDATEAQKKKYRVALQKATDEANALMISAALVRVEDAHGKQLLDTISPENVKALGKSLGESQLLKLVSAAMSASSGDVDIPVPFSRRNYEDDLS